MHLAATPTADRIARPDGGWDPGSVDDASARPHVGRGGGVTRIGRPQAPPGVFKAPPPKSARPR